jgi:hypothetical protein
VSAEDSNTGVGAAVIETARSESPVISTRTDVDVVLLDEFGSVVCEVTSAEFTIVVPAAVAAATVMTYVNAAVVVPLAKLAVAVQITCPVALTAGEVQVHPDAGVTEANVVFDGVC